MPLDPVPAWVLTRRRTIGARVREARRDAALTQMELAHLIGREHRHIHHIEYATTDPSLSDLLLIAHVCGVSLSDLVRE